MSTVVPTIHGLGDIAAAFDGILCDVWGVLHNGREAFPDVLDCLIRMRSQGAAVVLLSNTPRPHAPILKQLEDFAIDHRHFDDLITAGDLTRAALMEMPKATRCFHIGPERDLPLFDGVEMVQAASAAAADIVVCTGLYDDGNDTAEDYRDRLAPAAALGLPLICANPDIIVHQGDRVLLCAGAIAKVYEDMGGPVRYFGKPYGDIYEWALRSIEKRRQAPASRSRCLAIGDGLATDVAGARRQGIPVLFVTSGIHRDEPSYGAGAFPRQRPNWIIDRLRW